VRVRQQRIVDFIKEAGTCSVEELSRRFEVSGMTIRRDLACLDKLKLLERIKGGAQRLSVPGWYYEQDVYSRLQVNTAEKESIAAAAAGLVDDGDVLMVDSSSTVLHFIRTLRDKRNLTVITHGALPASELARLPNVQAVVVGGMLDPQSLTFVGSETEQKLAGLHADKFFLSTKGFVPTEGTYESSVAMMSVKRAMARAAGRLILLVDHTKFNERSLSKVIGIDQIDVVVTDARTPARVVGALRRAGMQVIVTRNSS